MSQDSRENFAVKTQISIGGWQGAGEGGEGEKKEKEYVESQIKKR